MSHSPPDNVDSRQHASAARNVEPTQPPNPDLTIQLVRPAALAARPELVTLSLGSVTMVAQSPVARWHRQWCLLPHVST